MKKIVFLFVLYVGFSQAQTDETAIRKELKVYTEAIKSKDYEKVIGYTHPVIFEIASKEELLRAIEITFSGSEELKVDFKSMVFNDISKTIEHNGDNIAKVDSTMEMDMTFKEALDNETSEMMLNLMGAQFGEDCCKYNEKTNTLNVITNTAVYAVYGKSTNNEWKFMRYDQQTKALFHKIIPEDIMTQL